MFRVFFFIFISFTTFGSISITAENLSKAKLLELFLKDNFYLESEYITTSKEMLQSDINLVIISEKVEVSLFSKLIYKKKEYIINSTHVSSINIHGEDIAYFSDKLLQIPYLVLVNNTLYINGYEFLENEILRKILIETLNEKFDKLKIKESSKVKSTDSKNKTDITKITNTIIYILVIGIVFFLLFLGFSIKKRFGNPFKGD